MTEQQPGIQLTTGFDLANFHLNHSMRLLGHATPEDLVNTSPEQALDLSNVHAELAYIGSQVAIAEALGRIATQMEKSAKAQEAPQSAPQRVDDPMVDQGAERPL